MEKKLKLNSLKVKSFIIVQNAELLKTVKAGNFGSDGPPLTTTAGSGQQICSVQCNSQVCSDSECDNTNYCNNTGTNNQYSNNCGDGSGANMTH